MFNMTDDNKIMLDSAEFGDFVVALKNSDGFNAIFERQYVDTNDVQGYSPTIYTETKNTATLQSGDLLLIHDVKYRYILQEPDGTGMSLGVLEIA